MYEHARRMYFVSFHVASSSAAEQADIVMVTSCVKDLTKTIHAVCVCPIAIKPGQTSWLLCYWDNS